MKGLAPSAATCADLSGSSRGSPADALGDLRVTVRASPPGTSPRTSYSSRSEHPVQFPGDFADPSHGMPSISFGTSDESHSAVPREGDVHHGGPGAPSLAQPGRDEGRRQGMLSRRPHLPGRAVRRHRRGLCPAVLGGTAAD